MQATLYLATTRAMGAPEPRICYERADPFCHSLNQPRLLVIALNGQFRYTLMTDKLSRAIQIAERVHPLAQEQNDPALMIGAYLNLACTLYCLGDFESARQYARKEQKAISLQKRAEATYAEYRRQKASGSGGC